MPKFNGSFIAALCSNCIDSFVLLSTIKNESFIKCQNCEKTFDNVQLFKVELKK